MEKRPGDEVGPHEEIRAEESCFIIDHHRSKKKATKNVLSARFNLKKAIKTHSTKYLSSTHYELITKVYLEKKKERRKARKKTEKKRKIKTVQSLPVFVAGLGEGLSKTCQTLDAS